MRTKYENLHFETSLSSSIEKHLIKLKIKKSIGRFIGKPYQRDTYLTFAETVLNRSPSPVVVDVGANIGTTVLPLAKLFSKGRFIAVEPHPLPAARFIQNCQLNNISNVALVCAAIAPTQQEKTELVKIYTCPSNSGGHRITGFEGREDFIPPESLAHITIPSVSLESVFINYQINYCDILKIDVEGFEDQVLESLGKLLTPSNVGFVITEYGPEGMEKAKRTGWDMVNRMLNSGFKCLELRTNRKIEKLKDIPILPDYTVTDFVFYS